MHEYKILERGKPPQEAGKALILLHGRGGSAADIMTLADEFCDNNFYIAAPQATASTWYPYSFMAEENMNEPWLSSAVQIVKKLIDETKKNIPVDHIFLMGFSQGACLTLEVAGRFADQYAGVAAFTGGLIGKEIVKSRYSGDFAGAPVFIGNSNSDPHVPEQRSRDSGQLLALLGANVTVEIYPGMLHTITRQEINQVKELMF